MKLVLAFSMCITYTAFDIFDILPVLTEMETGVGDTNRRKGHRDQQRHKEGEAPAGVTWQKNMKIFLREGD